MNRTKTATACGLLVLGSWISLPACAGVNEGMQALAKRDFSEAHRQFEAAGADGEALYQLARMAYAGLGEPRDPAKAMQYYARAWEAGHQQAGLELARGLTVGDGVAANEARGTAIIQKLAEAGVARAQYLYGWSLEFGRYGAEKDEAAAADWYRRAMEGGNVEGLVGYASLLSLGKGVPKDPARAVEILKTEAERERPLAMVALGRLARAGQGMPKDEAEAFRLFKRASDLGWPDAQYEVGAAYVFGRGIARDPAEGARWIDAAARNGNVLAQRMYGELFRTGTGVPKNPVQAFKWFTIAFNNSGGTYSAANQARALLAANMSTAQVQEASRQASEYRRESGVKPVAVKLPELAHGDTVEIGGRTIHTPLPEGFVNAWEFAERTRRSRPNQDSWTGTLLVALKGYDMDRMKMGLRVEDLRVLEFLKYEGDDQVNVSAELFADMRKQMREALERRTKAAGASPRPFSEKVISDDEHGLLILQSRAPNAEQVGDAVGFALVRLNERAVFVRVIGNPGTAEGQESAAALLKAWVGLLNDAN